MKKNLFTPMFLTVFCLQSLVTQNLIGKTDVGSISGAILKSCSPLIGRVNP